MLLVVQGIPADSVRHVVRQVFARPEYEWVEAVRRHWLRDLWWGLRDWLARFSEHHPTGARLLFWGSLLLLLGLLVHLGFTVWRIYRATVAAPRVATSGAAPVVLEARRLLARAEALADAFDETVDVLPLDELSQSGPWDLFVNATPLGTAGSDSRLPVPESVLAKAGYVYDLVYNPRTTPLVEAAKRMGKPATSGLEMLLHQAAKSFELWTGRSPPVEAMRRAAKGALG